MRRAQRRSREEAARRRRLARTVPAGMLVALALAGGEAHAARDDARVWAGAALGLRPTDRLRFDFLAQVRASQDVSEFERVLLTPSVGGRLHGSLWLDLGYDAHLIETPIDVTEQRAWQQLSLATPFRSLGIGHRLRLEQRFIEGVSETSVVLRWRLRLAHPIAASAWSAVVSNEAFFAFNQVTLGLRDGLGEDRVFVGLRRELGDAARFEVGYQLQWTRRTTRCS